MNNERAAVPGCVELAGRFPAKGRPFAVLFHPDCLGHDPGPSHPERIARLEAVFEGCLELPLDCPVEFFVPEPAKPEELWPLYSKEYLSRLERACADGSGHFRSGDNPVSRGSYRAAMAAAGQAIELGRRLVKGMGGFALTRPPGHHSGSNTAEGFCFINNLVLAVEEFRKAKPGAKVLVVDFDVHHCNGTDYFFSAEPGVFLYSIHGLPSQLYPGSGWEYEIGEGPAKGYTKNVPLPLGVTGDEWLAAFRRGLEASAAFFGRFDCLLVSAGFDAHKDDPFGAMGVEDRHFFEALGLLVEAAEKSCPGRTGFVLEGGYNLEVLRRLVPGFIEGLSRKYNAGI